MATKGRQPNRSPTWTQRTSYPSIHVERIRVPAEISPVAMVFNKNAEKNINSNRSLLCKLQRKYLQHLESRRKVMNRTLIAYTDARQTSPVSPNSDRLNSTSQSSESGQKEFRKLPSIGSTRNRSLENRRSVLPTKLPDIVSKTKTLELKSTASVIQSTSTASERFPKRSRTRQILQQADAIYARDRENIRNKERKQVTSNATLEVDKIAREKYKGDEPRATESPNTSNKSNLQNDATTKLNHSPSDKVRNISTKLADPDIYLTSLRGILHQCRCSRPVCKLNSDSKQQLSRAPRKLTNFVPLPPIRA